MTEDADLASPAKLATIGDPIPKRLEDADFERRMTGVEQLPVMKFFARENDVFYVEFIAPLIGGDSDRTGKPRTLVEVGGATAQLLRHVDLLRFEPWELDLGDGVIARIANPASYLAQKVLTRRDGQDAINTARTCCTSMTRCRCSGHGWLISESLAPGC